MDEGVLMDNERAVDGSGVAAALNGTSAFEHLT